MVGFIVVIVLLLGGMVYLNYRSQNADVGADLSGFAQCLVDKKVTFFGAFWCPHCQASKKMFGAARTKLPYVECSTADGNGQLQVCKDKNIQQYPTWEFADGSRLTGERTLEELSLKSECPLPEGAGAAASIQPVVNTNASSSPVATTTAQ